MPNRIIREGILTSERVDLLDWPAEVFYRRLLSKVDDHGLYDARPSVLRAALYPLRIDRVREADISRWIAECEKAGLLVLYCAADDKQYMKVLDTRWKARSDPRFPVPTQEQLQTIARNCEQVQSKSLTLSLSKSLTETESGPPREFVPPTPREVEDYGRIVGCSLSGEKFVANYAKRGWRDAQGQLIVDWRALVTEWKIRDGERRQGERRNQKLPSVDEALGASPGS